MKIKINGNFYIYFNEFALSDTLNSVAAAFSFTAKYDPADPSQADIFRPLGFQQVQFFDDNDQIFFTGTILNHEFNSEAAPQLVAVSGYSLGGVLEDCTIPFSAYPLESAGRTLKEITTRLLSYFNLQLIIDPSVTNECNQVFVKSVARPKGKIKEYLAKLAAQKNVVMTHGINGEIIYFRPDVNAPSVGLFTAENTLNMRLKINGQDMHSDLTVLRQAEKKKAKAIDFDDHATGAGSADSVKNPLVKGFRPHVDLLTSGSGKDTLRGAKNALADELRNITLTFGLVNWPIIKPGDVIEAQNDEVRLHQKTRFIVEAVSTSENAKERIAKLVCVIPESFTGGQPKDIFAVQ